MYANCMHIHANRLPTPTASAPAVSRKRAPPGTVIGDSRGRNPSSGSSSLHPLAEARTAGGGRRRLCSGSGEGELCGRPHCLTPSQLSLLVQCVVCEASVYAKCRHLLPAKQGLGSPWAGSPLTDATAGAEAAAAPRSAWHSRTWSAAPLAHHTSCMRLARAPPPLQAPVW